MKKSSYILFLFVLLASCDKDNFEIDNLNGNNIGALGHGGMGFSGSYPMNSFESIFYSLSLGADGSEFDVQMTKDSVLVLFHDKELENSTNGNGHIYEKTWDEIKNSTYKYPLYTNYKIITVDELFSGLESQINQLPKTSYTFSLDCKYYNPNNSEVDINTFTNALIKVIDKYNLTENIFIELQEKSLMHSLKNKRPELKIFALTDFYEGMQLADEIDLHGIITDTDKITKEQVKLAHEKGLMISVYNTDTKNDNINAINKNVDFIQSDKLKHLIELLE